MNPPKRLPGMLIALAVVAVAAGALHARHSQTASSLRVQPFRANGIYAVGERAGWTVAASGHYRYSLRKNNLGEIESGTLDFSLTGTTTIGVTLKEPAMLFLQITPLQGGAPMNFGASVAPTKLKPVVPRPKDFDAFWRAKIAKLKAIPAAPQLALGPSYRPDVEYATIQMDHVNGTHVYGQMAKPKRSGKFPALLLLQWASPPYPLHPSWVIEPAAQGFLVLDIEPHDVLPTEPESYYKALPSYLRNYGSTGSEDRDKSAFVEMYLRGYRALDYLTTHPNWDGKNLVVMGTSMGGQQALCVAGLHSKVTHVIVNEPAGCDLNAGLHGRQQGYPFFPTNDPKVMETARYVDAINFASRIKAKSLVAMGFTDDVAPPAGIWTAFNQIRGPKEAVPMFDSPHNNIATPAQQAPYTRRSAEWLAALAKGDDVRVHYEQR